MNESTDQDTLRLKQMLEEVTAADTPVAGHAPAGPCDAEGASLREAWLAFGRLIRAADDSLPAMPNVLPAGPSTATPIAPLKSRRSRWLRPIAAAAAALLVAVTFGWWIGRDGKQDISGPSLAQTGKPEQATPQPEKLSPQAAVARTETAANKPAKAGAAKTSTWDDPLETQIAAVSQQIRNVQQNWQHRVDDVDLVQYRIDEVADSLQDDTL